MPYSDGTEEPPEPNDRPKICPLCGGEIETRWVGTHHKLIHTDTVRAVPVFMCPACNVAVQLRKLPKGKLYTTRKAARADPTVAAKIKERADRIAALQARSRWKAP